MYLALDPTLVGGTPPPVNMSSPPRAFMITVGRNESAKFMRSFAKHYAGSVRGWFFFDDRSTDATLSMAAAGGAVTMVRPDECPSFLEHEGRFREYAWRRAMWALGIQEGDWLFAPDCDEFLVGESSTVKGLIEDAIAGAEDQGLTSVAFDLPDIWRIDDEGWWARTDGAWRTNHGVRLVKYTPDLQFLDARVGPGSVPAWRMNNPWRTMDAQMLHLGYAWENAPAIKHERYRDMKGNRHSEMHINSILQPPSLAIYDYYQLPDVRDAEGKPYRFPKGNS